MKNSCRSNCWAAATEDYMELAHSLGKFLVHPVQIYGFQMVVIFEVFKICCSLFWKFLIFWHFSPLGFLKLFWNHHKSTLREILVRNRLIDNCNILSYFEEFINLPPSLPTRTRLTRPPSRARGPTARLSRQPLSRQPLLSLVCITWPGFSSPIRTYVQLELHIRRTRNHFRNKFRNINFAR